MPALAVTAAGDGHLEPALPRVSQYRLELLDLAGVVHPRHRRRIEAGHVHPQERIVPAEQVAVRRDEGAEVGHEGQRENAEPRH